MTTKKKTVKKKELSKKAAPKKSTVKKTTKKTKADEPSLKIMSTSKCQTVSNKSTLTYNIGSDDKDEIYIRVLSNSGCGFFSNEWIAIDNITALLSDTSNEGPITSINLTPLFKGKSSNTPAFLAAALLNEGVLLPFEDKKRSYVYSSTDKLLAKVAKKTK